MTVLTYANPAADDPSGYAEGLQGMLDRCAETGGGCVRVAIPGVHLCDGLRLRNGVTLEITEGVTLRASGDESTYEMRPGPFELLAHDTPIRAFIHGKGLTGARIRGGGMIDGNYERFILPGQGPDVQHIATFTYPRPMTIYLEDCEDSVIEDVTVGNAPFWTIHLVGCRNTVVRDVTIRNEMRMPNTDGIDVDRCDNTLIERCDIVTGDDGVCPKCTEETARYGGCSNLAVRDCRIVTRSSAIKLGSSSFADFENMTFERLTIRDSNRGLAFQLRDPGSARNIVFRDVTITTSTFSREWWGSAEAIYLTILPRDASTDMTGRLIEHVRFERVSGTCGLPVVAVGYAPGAIRDVTLDGVTLEATGGAGADAGKAAAVPSEVSYDVDVRPWRGGEERVSVPAADMLGCGPAFRSSDCDIHFR